MNPEQRRTVTKRAAIRDVAFHLRSSAHLPAERRLALIDEYLRRQDDILTRIIDKRETTKETL